MTTLLRHIRQVGLLTFLLMMGMSVSARDSVQGDGQSIHLDLTDSLSISILTCTPGPDLYSKFGHTALRVRDLVNDRDVVFNYGCFDGSANDFIFKFLLGQTDYLLGAEPFDYLVKRYGYMGVGVTEQVLNLSSQEKNELLSRLLINILPENQEYRYKWLGVNCTNMVQYMMESLAENEGGKVMYEWGDEHELTMSVRDMLHETLRMCPWVSFGIDMILGHEIDGFTLTAINPTAKQRTKLFMPSYFMEVVDRSWIENGSGEQRKYVVEKHELIPPTYYEAPPTPFTPLVVFSALLVAIIGLLAWDWKRREISIWLDASLAILQGLAGILVAFLYFFSEHPGVDSNWLVVIFNPLPLFYAAWMIVCHRRQKKNRLAAVNMAVLAAFFLTMKFCPQSFNAAMWVLVSALLVRATLYFLLQRKLFQKK